MLLNCGVGEDSWVPSTAGRSSQSILKEISPEYSLEGLMLKLKLQYFGHLMQRTDSLDKTLMLGKIEGRRRRGWQDEMFGWHHWHNGLEFELFPGVGDGQGGLVCCSPWGHKESDMTEQLNWTVNAGDTGLIPGPGSFHMSPNNWSLCATATEPSAHSPQATTAEPALRSLWAPATEFACPRAWAPQQEKPLQWEACSSQLESSPHSL